jgi:hypothetical protein
MHTALRHPLLHFMMLGSALFGLDQARTPDVPPVHPIVLDAELAQQLASDWQRDTGRVPTEVEQRASLHRHLQEQRLLNEALRQGLAERDPVVQTRLINNLRFLAPERDASDATLLREAHAMGMVETDVVTRRRLIQRMSEQLAGEAMVDHAAVQRHIAAHPERYAQPARYRLEHVFVADDSGQASANALRERLVAGVATEPGDPFLLGDLPEWISEAELRRRLGQVVADTLPELAPDTWSRPLPSAWGWHLIRVTAVTPARTEITPELRRRATYAWLAEREGALLHQALQQLASRYPADWQVTLPVDPS